MFALKRQHCHRIRQSGVVLVLEPKQNGFTVLRYHGIECRSSIGKSHSLEVTVVTICTVCCNIT
jgi:hypothetical protein